MSFNVARVAYIGYIRPHCFSLVCVLLRVRVAILLLFNFTCVISTIVTLCNHIGGVMVSVLASSVVDRWFESRSALRRKSKDWSARNQDNVFEWDDISIHGLLFK